ncbi:hypothetical protein LI90_3061 [Carbonactinospora thermoautotrophica]|uniref:Uncharacterized protein n=1 Tax=Carbonactinospora thermoautotrophica TaxID=1469144 RepID=A0A132MVU4_9ACTN|nr:hypothetical protein LI90_3061 [Carbonactinospora thermoautotrophica]
MSRRVRSTPWTLALWSASGGFIVTAHVFGSAEGRRRCRRPPSPISLTDHVNQTQRDRVAPSSARNRRVNRPGRIPGRTT